MSITEKTRRLSSLLALSLALTGCAGSGDPTRESINTAYPTPAVTPHVPPALPERRIFPSPFPELTPTQETLSTLEVGKPLTINFHPFKDEDIAYEVPPELRRYLWESGKFLVDGHECLFQIFPIDDPYYYSDDKSLKDSFVYEVFFGYEKDGKLYLINHKLYIDRLGDGPAVSNGLNLDLKYDPKGIPNIKIVPANLQDDISVEDFVKPRILDNA